jgi:predicted transcriptional regulator
LRPFLQGRDGYRLRIGSYRVIFDEDAATILAIYIGRRVSAAILRGEGRLKAIRNWRGDTQLDLNVKTGIGQGYLSDLETGRRAGTPETIAKLAQALNVPVEWLS